MHDGERSASPDWKPLGPEGGFFLSYLFDENNPDWCLAGGDDSSGIWKTETGGARWRLVSAMVPNATGWRLTRDPSDCNIIYTPDIYGRHSVLRSTNGGETWRPSYDGIRHRRIWAMAAVQRATGVSAVLAGCANGWRDPGEPPIPDGGAIYRSTDQGESWMVCDFPNTAVRWLDAAPDGSRVLAGTRSGLFVSLDAGISWNRVGSLPAGPVRGVRVDDCNRAYAATPEDDEHGLYATYDGGVTWRGLGLQGIEIWDIVIEPGVASETIYVATQTRGVMKTTDAGATWSAANSGLHCAMIISLARSPHGSLWCSTYANEGILRSDDGATRWHRCNGSLKAGFMTTVRTDPNDPHRILATGLGPYSFDPKLQAPTLWDGHIEDDGDVQWRLCLEPKWQTYSPSVAPGVPSRMVVGTFGAGVLLTVDGGKGFESVCAGGYCTAAAFHPNDPNIAAASFAKMNEDYQPQGYLLAHTQDGGSSWTCEEVGFVADHLLFESDSTRVWAAGDRGLFVSADSGCTWKDVGVEGGGLTALAGGMAGGRFRMVVVLEKGRIKVSDDLASTWRELKGPELADPGSIVRAVFVDPEDPENIYLGYDAAETHPTEHDPLTGGIWNSPNSGASWRDITGNLPCNHVRGIIQTIEPKLLVVATYSMGLFAIPAGSFA